MGIWSLLIYSIIGLTLVGFVTVVRWLARALFHNPAAEFPPIPSAPMPGRSPDREALRLKVESLYFEKKISLEVMRELLGQPTPPPAPAPKSSIYTPEEPRPVPPAPPPPPPIQPAPVAEPRSKPEPTPTHSMEDTPRASGFFSTESIKTLLISGAALFVLSVYLFVRSYWTFVPDTMKFLALFLTSLGIYAGGASLLKRNLVPRTAQTLLYVALLVIPFNIYAANVLLFGRGLDPAYVWMLGFALLSLASFNASRFLPTLVMGLIGGAGALLGIWCAGWAYGWGAAQSVMAVAVGCLALFSASTSIDENQDVAHGMGWAVHGGCLAVALALLFNGFFLNSDPAWPTAVTFAAMGVVFILQSRLMHPGFAYLAGLSFMGAGAYLLRQYDIPVYKFGLVYVPAALLCMSRAWTFERSGRRELAAPYFFWGQVALAGSLAATFQGLWTQDNAFGWGMGLLLVSSLAYGVSGAFTGRPVFSYVSGLVFLATAGQFVSHNQLDFASGLLLFTAVGAVFVAMGLLTTPVNEAQMGQPLSYLGLGTLTVGLALMGGRWLATGELVPPLPPDQLDAGLWVAALSAFSYAGLALFKRQPGFLYPALLSASGFYLFMLQKAGWTVDILTISFLAPASMLGFWALQAAGKDRAARCFALWGEMVLAGVVLGAVASPSVLGLQALLLCTLSMAPGLLPGRQDMVTAFLAGVYASHMVWYRHVTPGFFSPHLAPYALQLVLVNCGVVAFRSLLTFWRPEISVTPYRGFAAAFSVVALLWSLLDMNVAWQVYLISGLLALVVSYVHYEGRHKWVGALLLLLSAEWFMAARHISYVEAYTVPVALFLLAWGYLQRADKEARDILYGLGQAMLYLPSSFEAIKETWGWHGIFLGVASLFLMLAGMGQRNRCLTFGSFLVLMANALVQSHQMFLTVPRWVYLGLGGLTLMALGGLFEFRREKLIQLKDRVVETFEHWD